MRVVFFGHRDAEEAILRRNKWMLKNCDAAVFFVRHSFGGAAAMKRAAIAAGKRIYEIGG